MTNSIVNNTTVRNGYNVLSFTIPATTVGNTLLFIGEVSPIPDAGWVPSQLSISGGGTWSIGATTCTDAVNESDASNPAIAFYATCKCTTSTTTITFTLPPSTQWNVLAGWLFELSGADSSPVNTVAASSASASVTGSPSVAGCAAFAVGGSHNNPGSWPAGYTDLGYNNLYWYLNGAYDLSTASGSQTVTNTAANADNLLVVWIAPAGGGTTVNLAATVLNLSQGKISIKGTTVLALRNTNQTLNQTALSGRTEFDLRGAVFSNAQGNAEGSTLLRAFTRQTASGHTNFIGHLTFAVRTHVSSTAQTLLSTVPLATLLMRSISTAFGQAKAQGKLSFKGTYLSLSSGRTFGVGKTELRGSAQSAASAVAAPKFGVKLVAHNAASTMARNSAQFIAGLKLAVFAASFGHATPGRSMVLFLRSFSSSAGLLRASGSAQFKALVRFASQALLRFYQPTPVSPTAAFVARAAPLYYNSQFPGVFYNLIFMPGDAMPAVRDFPPIDALIQKQTLGVDFGLFLPPGVTLTGTPTVSISVTQGVDPNAAERLLASPTIGTIQPGQNGTGVIDVSLLQQVGTCLGGVDYLLVFSCDRSDGDNVVAWAHLPCVTPGSAANG